MFNKNPFQNSKKSDPSDGMINNPKNIMKEWKPEVSVLNKWWSSSKMYNLAWVSNQADTMEGVDPTQMSMGPSQLDSATGNTNVKEQKTPDSMPVPGKKSMPIEGWPDKVPEKGTTTETKSLWWEQTVTDEQWPTTTPEDVVNQWGESINGPGQSRRKSIYDLAQSGTDGWIAPNIPTNQSADVALSEEDAYNLKEQIRAQSEDLWEEEVDVIFYQAIDRAKRNRSFQEKTWIQVNVNEAEVKQKIREKYPELDELSVQNKYQNSIEDAMEKKFQAKIQEDSQNGITTDEEQELLRWLSSLERDKLLDRVIADLEDAWIEDYTMDGVQKVWAQILKKRAFDEEQFKETRWFVIDNIEKVLWIPEAFVTDLMEYSDKRAEWQDKDWSFIESVGNFATDFISGVWILWKNVVSTTAWAVFDTTIKSLWWATKPLSRVDDKLFDSKVGDYLWHVWDETKEIGWNIIQKISENPAVWEWLKLLWAWVSEYQERAENNPQTSQTINATFQTALAWLDAIWGKYVFKSVKNAKKTLQEASEWGLNELKEFFRKWYNKTGNPLQGDALKDIASIEWLSNSVRMHVEQEAKKQLYSNDKSRSILYKLWKKVQWYFNNSFEKKVVNAYVWWNTIPITQQRKILQHTNFLFSKGKWLNKLQAEEYSRNMVTQIWEQFSKKASALNSMLSKNVALKQKVLWPTKEYMKKYGIKPGKAWYGNQLVDDFTEWLIREYKWWESGIMQLDDFVKDWVKWVNDLSTKINNKKAITASPQKIVKAIQDAPEWAFKRSKWNTPQTPELLRKLVNNWQPLDVRDFSSIKGIRSGSYWYKYGDQTASKQITKAMSRVGESVSQNIDDQIKALSDIKNPLPETKAVLTQLKSFRNADKQYWAHSLMNKLVNELWQKPQKGITKIVSEIFTYWLIGAWLWFAWWMATWSDRWVSSAIWVGILSGWIGVRFLIANWLKWSEFKSLLKGASRSKNISGALKKVDSIADAIWADDPLQKLYEVSKSLFPVSPQARSQVDALPWWDKE